MNYLIVPRKTLEDILSKHIRDEVQSGLQMILELAPEMDGETAKTAMAIKSLQDLQSKLARLSDPSQAPQA